MTQLLEVKVGWVTEAVLLPATNLGEAKFVEKKMMLRSGRIRYSDEKYTF